MRQFSNSFRPVMNSPHLIKRIKSNLNNKKIALGTSFFVFASILFLVLPKITHADPQNFLASNVTWDGTTLNFDTNTDMTTVPAGDPGPYHDLYFLNIGSSGGASYWQAVGTNNISCSATHCSVTNLTNYNGNFGYSSDNGVTQVQLSFWDSNDELVGQSQPDVPWTPVPYGPQIGAIPATSINEGDTYTQSGSFTETGATSWTATVDYGDGTGAQPLTLNSDNTFSLNHTYQNYGTFAVTVKITDDQGKTSSVSSPIVVHSLPVTISPIQVEDPVAYVNSAVVVSSSYTSPGPSDLHTARWNWGDGSSSAGGVRSQSGSQTVGTDNHTYHSDGTYTITLTITASDGASQSTSTTVQVKTEPAGYGSAGYVQSSLKMIDDHTLMLQLQNMPTADYSGFEVCEYGDLTNCNSDFIVGPGGINYTVVDGQYTSATIDISPSVAGQAVEFGFYPLDNDGQFVGFAAAVGHQVVTLTNAPLAVTGISTSGSLTSVSVNSDYQLNYVNAFACYLFNASGSISFGVSLDTSTNSCIFQTSDVDSMYFSGDTSFYLAIDDVFDITLIKSQTYDFSQFNNNYIPAPDGLSAQSPTTQAPSLSWNSVSNANSYNIYRNGSKIGSASDTSYVDNSTLTDGTYSYSVTAVINGSESPQSAPVSVDLEAIPPAITSASSFTTGVRQLIAPSSFTVTTTGTPTASLTESGTLPTGLTFVDNGNGTANFSGLIAAGTAGTYNITITATNSAGSYTQHFTLVVSNVDSAPTVIYANVSNITVTHGVSMTPVTFTATGSGKNFKIYLLSGALPPGLSLHDNKDGTASLFGTPSRAGVYTFTLEAANKVGSITQSFTVTVN